jgi:hypothetical protein
MAFEHGSGRGRTRQVSHPRRVVIGSGHHPSPVGAKRYTHDRLGMAFEHGAGGGRIRQVPHSRRVVIGPGHHMPRVRAERHARDPIAMAFESGGSGGSAETSHTRAPSLDPVATRSPSGLNATLVTLPRWPSSRVAAGVAPDKAHTRAVLSKDPVTTRLPSGLNATLVTEPRWPFSTVAVPAHWINDPRWPSLG